MVLTVYTFFGVSIELNSNNYGIILKLSTDCFGVYIEGLT